MKSSIIIILCIYTLGIDAELGAIVPLKRPIWLLANSTIELSCTGTDGTQIEWLKDGVKLTSNERISISFVYETEGLGTLSIKDTKPTDAGTYTCQAGADKQEANVKFLQVTPLSARYKYGQDVTIGVLIDGLSDEDRKSLIITWYKNGTEKIVSDELRVIDTTNNTLTLIQPTRADIGLYVCEFRFQVKEKGMNRQTILSQSVHVNAKPMIKVNYKSKNLVEGDVLLLECEATGYPTPDITWFKDSEVIVSGNRTQITDLNKDDTIFVKNGQLKITDLTFDDRADYMCEASNIYGSYNYTITLRVKDKLAALWPFMAIVCEVVILCVIIFIYEKKKGKELDKAAAHQNGKHAEYGIIKDIPSEKISKEDVRLRKS